MKDFREENTFYRSNGRGWKMHRVLSGCIESNAKRFIWSRSRRRISRLRKLSFDGSLPAFSTLPSQVLFHHTCLLSTCCIVQTSRTAIPASTPWFCHPNQRHFPERRHLCLQKNHALQTRSLKASNLIKYWNHTVKALSTYKNLQVTYPMPVSITQNLNHRTIRGLSMIISSSSSALSSTYVVAGSSLAE